MIGFLAGQRLWLLVGVGALVAAVVAAARRRQGLRVRFTELELLASVAPRRPGWRRHVSVALLLITLSLGVLTFARPVLRHTSRARLPGSVMVALDVSESMVATDVAPSRIVAMRQAATRFIAGLPPGLAVGVVSFDRTATVLTAPRQDHSLAVRAVAGLQAGPGTAIGDAVLLSLSALAAHPPGTSGAARIVLMSDGGNNAGATPQAAATTARAAHIPISTIAFGTPQGTVTLEGQVIPVPADYPALADLATSTGGTAYTAKTEQQLEDAFQAFQPATAQRTSTIDLTAWLIGALLVLLTLAVGLSVLWTPALP